MLVSMQEREYRAIPAISQSTIRDFHESSPADWLARGMNPKKPTPEMLVGSLTHALLFEPDTVDSQYARAEKVNRRTKIGKADAADQKAEAEKNGQALIDDDDWQDAEEMCARVKAHPLASKLILGAEFEQAILGHTIMDQVVKGKLDCLHADKRMIGDLKTTSELLTDRNLFWLLDRPSFKIQAAFYVDLMKLETDLNFNFFFLFVQRGGAREMRRVVVGDEIPDTKAWLDEGRQLYRNAMQRMIECQSAGIYPGLIENVYFPQSKRKQA